MRRGRGPRQPDSRSSRSTHGPISPRFPEVAEPGVPRRQSVAPDSRREAPKAMAREPPTKNCVRTPQQTLATDRSFVSILRLPLQRTETAPVYRGKNSVRRIYPPRIPISKMTVAITTSAIAGPAPIACALHGWVRREPMVASLPSQDHPSRAGSSSSGAGCRVRAPLEAAACCGACSALWRIAPCVAIASRRRDSPSWAASCDLPHCRSVDGST
jgi:hypothetical protein